MARLNFSTQLTRQQPIRSRPSKYDQSLLRNTFRDLGPGDSYSDVYYPYKYLPVGFKDVTTEDYVVINKGRIVSLLTHGNTTPLSGITYPASGGSIDVFISALDSTTQTTLIDDTFWGYPNHVGGLLVYANGGYIHSGQYTSRDVTACTLQLGGTEVTSALSASPVFAANLPIGIAAGDVYQDIRGKYLNYTMWDKAVAPVTDWYIEVPYVKVAVASEGTYTVDPSTPEIVGTAMTFDTMNSKYCYMTIYSTDVFQAGAPVKSDVRGNYILENRATALATNTGNTSQTIGRLILTDCRYPKDLLELVDTYEGTNMPGTATAGLPSYLFNFAHDYLVATSASHRLADVVDAVKAGIFGGARILVNI